jgi:putative ABC transport system permease protein
MRTLLGLIGLSIPIFGVLGLFSLSRGLRYLVTDTLGQLEGVVVVRRNAPTPIFSDLPAGTAEHLRKIPGVRVVAPELWKVAPPIEGAGALANLSGLLSGSSPTNPLWNIKVVEGEDIAAHRQLKNAIGPKALLPPEKGGGRYLGLEDRGRANIVISTRVAEEFRDASGRPKRVGDTLKIGSRPFTIVGIGETGSLLLDVTIVMDIETARELLRIPEGAVSSFYVEAEDPTRVDEVIKAIGAFDSQLDARRISEFKSPFNAIIDRLDQLLLMTIGLALLVGVVGIVNTMLMSTTERFVEFGVMRTNGWSRGDVLKLVTAESATLGLLAGVLGVLMAVGGVALANQFIQGGLRLFVTPQFVALGLALSLVTGTLGGLYPAWTASRLVPMDAIRWGSR